MHRPPRRDAPAPDYPALDRRTFLRRSTAALGFAVLWAAPMTRRAVAALADDVDAWLPSDVDWRWTWLDDDWGVHYRLGVVADGEHTLECVLDEAEFILTEVDQLLGEFGRDGLMIEGGIEHVEAFALQTMQTLCGASGDDDSAGDDDDSACLGDGVVSVVLEYELSDPDQQIMGMMPPPDPFGCYCSSSGR